jgi:signal transduction histidine kinase
MAVATGAGRASSERAIRTIRRVRAVLRRSPTAVDAVFAVALATLGAVTGVVVVAPAVVGWTPPPAPIITVWAAALAAPLLLRRRFPCTVLVVTVVHFPFYWALGQLHEIACWLVLGVAVYSAAAYGRRPRAAWCAAAALVASTALFTSTMWLGGVGPASVAVFAVENALPYLLGWTLGHITRRMREYRAVLEERNAELDRRRAADARRAVLEERVRIARELHDVVAHHVSLIGIQAGVAARLFTARPDDAREAISDVQAGSRQVIDNLQALLGVLRSDDPDADPDTASSREPQPGLDRLPELVAAVGRAGLPVELAVEGTPRPLAPGLELSAYRIVQEALTNSLRHAHAGHAHVAVRYDARCLEVEVVDDGRGPGATRSGGRGLAGMRERVTLHGGRLEVGARPEGGFRVHAVLGRP